MSESWVTSKEGFRPIPGWVGEYSISSRGRVRSEARTVERRNGFRYRVSERILRPQRHRGGLLSVQLKRPGERQCCYVHVLVREAFGDRTSRENPHARREPSRTGATGTMTTTGTAGFPTRKVG